MTILRRNNPSEAFFFCAVTQKGAGEGRNLRRWGGADATRFFYCLLYTWDKEAMD